MYQMRSPARLSVLVLTVGTAAWAQYGQVSGIVQDPQGATVSGASVAVSETSTHAVRQVQTNSSGFYTAAFLPPGTYTLAVSATGFKKVVRTELKLETGQSAKQDFQLEIGTTLQATTVSSTSSELQTENAAVASVVDQNLVANLPLNGRSFNNLFLLVPGVQPSAGGYSVNGQRNEGNQYSFDGVSANVGVYGSATFAGTAGGGGNLASTNAAGGTNGLLSVDALQEFQIQTSSYAPEFGRTPGGQIQVSSRSGTNAFHGTASDYFRNSVLDANNWFNNQLGIPRQRENQHDFGGTLGGPVIPNRTFFFFSYEGLRLLTPQTLISPVPSLSLRTSAPAVLQPILNIFPKPNGPDLTGNGAVCSASCVPSGMAQYAASQGLKYNSDTTSIRGDHRIGDQLFLFARYNHAPSTALNSNGIPLLNLGYSLDLVTVGATWILSPTMTNDFRANWTSTRILLIQQVPAVNGAVVPPLTDFEPGRSPDTASFTTNLSFGGNTYFVLGKNNDNFQKQWNFVDNFEIVRGRHQLKFGFDYRRLNPGHGGPEQYRQQFIFTSEQQVLNNQAASAIVTNSQNFQMIFPAYAVFAQDTWQLRQNLVLTYGVRWDVAPPPTLKNDTLFAVNQVTDLQAMMPLPAGHTLYRTRYKNLSPRVGIAYTVQNGSAWSTVLRGGFGTFYDVQNTLAGYFSNGASGTVTYANASYPLTAAQASPPPVQQAAPPYANVTVIDPNLKTPLTYQWNGALEQQLGNNQSATVTYVGSAGHDLLRGIETLAPVANPYFKGSLGLGTSQGISNYQALQLQFRRRLSSNLQVLSSYVWSHSIDNASSYGYGTGYYIAPIAGYNALFDKASSDFDVRQTFSLGAHYEIPAPGGSGWVHRFLHGWSLDPLVRAQTAAPVDASIATSIDGQPVGVRPDLVAGVPQYLYDSGYPGGRRINPAAIADFTPQITALTQLRQGTLPRNAFRGFGLLETDLSAARDFQFVERVGLQFRADFFNIPNRSNFGLPNNQVGPYFGLSQGTYNVANVRFGGAPIPLYQIGGPRSIQLSLRLHF